MALFMGGCSYSEVARFCTNLAAPLLGCGDPLSITVGTSPLVQPESGVIPGIRDIGPGERKFIHSSGVTVFTMRDID